MVSAATGDGLDDLVDALAAAVPEGPHLYPDDDLTDLPDRLLAAEIVREQIFLQTHEEVPYAHDGGDRELAGAPGRLGADRGDDLCGARRPQGDPDRRGRRADQGDRRPGAASSWPRCWSARCICS